MKENKELTSNENYFKKGDTLKYVAIGIAGGSALLCFTGLGFFAFILMAMGLCVAAVIFIISTIGRSTEADIDEYVKKHIGKVEYKPDNEKAFEKRLLKTPAICVAEGYDLSDGLLYKKSKTGLIRSTKYSKAVIYPMDTALCICRRRISLVTEERDNAQTEIPYSSISSFEVKTEEKLLPAGKEPIKAKETRIVLKKQDGTTLSLIAQDSILIDEFVKRINEKIRSAS